MAIIDLSLRSHLVGRQKQSPQNLKDSWRADVTVAEDAASPLGRGRSILAKHRHDALDLDHKQAIVAFKIDGNSTLGIEEYLIIFGQGNFW